MSIRFDGQVAIVTGAGCGLGRSHALALAARGAKVVVNDAGGALDGSGTSRSAAEAVADEIHAAGGEALAHAADVADGDQVETMVSDTLKRWERIDILVNNAGILRDKTLAKMSLDDFRAVVDVHLTGSAICSRAVWPVMRERQYGRIVMTTSSSGLYGNFGQSNYGAAKMGCVGLMNVLHLEGQKYNIHVNALAPAAATRMTAGLMPPEMSELMTVESVSAGLLYLVSEAAPSRLIQCAGAGAYAAARIYETEGIYLPPGQQTPENVAARIDEILAIDGQAIPECGGDQSIKFARKAGRALGLALDGEGAAP